MNNPDPILNDQRMANALLHEIQWNKNQAIKYLMNYESDSVVTMLDKFGRVMGREDCYLAHLSSKQNAHLALSRLREHLSNQLLSKCDGNFFTFELYDQFVGKIDKKLEEKGYTLFPDKVTLIEPL